MDSSDRIFYAALRLYTQDCWCELHNRPVTHDSLDVPGSGALADLLGPQEQLARLCAYVGLDVDISADAIMRRLDLDHRVKGAA